MMRSIRLCVGFAAVLFMLLSAAGCEKALFANRGERTQYDRYMILRGQYRSATRTNAFGGEEPDLRSRLRPLETP